LALELDLKLIIDEKKGRKIALQHGVKVTGILGILIQNYRENHISLNDTQYYLNIYKQNGLRVSDSLEELFFQKLLQSKNEK